MKKPFQLVEGSSQQSTRILHEILEQMKEDAGNVLQELKKQTTLLQSISQKIGAVSPGPPVSIKIVPGTPE